MPLEDKQLRLRCVREVARRPVDASQLRIQAMNSIIYMAGDLRPMRVGNVDMEKEMQIIIECIEHIPAVKEVVTRELKVHSK